jgi:hypothetical protein
MSAIASTVIAHKFIVAILVASIAVSGGAIAVSNSSNSLGTMTVTVNPSFQITSLANLDFGNLSAGQTSTMTSTAQVSVTSAGNYTLFLQHQDFFRRIFSNLVVNVSGFGSKVITLNLEHWWTEFNVSTSGTYKLSVTVMVTVSSEIPQSITVTNLSFLGITTFPPHHVPTAPETGDNDATSSGDN